MVPAGQYPNFLVKNLVDQALFFIPGVNAASEIHDVFQVRLGQYGGNFARNFFNVPGMIPAAGITYAGLMTDTSAIIIYASNRR